MAKRRARSTRSSCAEGSGWSSRYQPSSGPPRRRRSCTGRASPAGARTGRLLELVGLDPSMSERTPETLSVGQQQRVSVARALALEPEALLLDEPTSALDEAARRKIEDLVRDLNAHLGLTMVFVSHDLSQVERVADRVVLLAEGKSVGEWERQEFFSAEGERARRLIAGGH
jgi:ABC-type glutathione transport system ATPase component